MKIDDLVKIYTEAFWHGVKRPQDTADHAGIRAVVKALRDAVVLKIDAHNGCGILATETAIDATRDVFNEILGSDAGEELPDYIRHLAAFRVVIDPGTAYCAPTADAAPAVCEWTGEEYVTYSTSCESEHEVDPHKAPPTYCPSCGKPIAFTEANHG